MRTRNNVNDFRMAAEREFDDDDTCGQPADITVVTNRIVGTHGTVRKSLAIKTRLLWFCFSTLFLHRFPASLRRRRSDGLRSTIEVILVTGMVLSVLYTLFTDSLLALAFIKVLVRTFSRSSKAVILDNRLLTIAL